MKIPADKKELWRAQEDLEKVIKFQQEKISELEATKKKNEKFAAILRGLYLSPRYKNLGTHDGYFFICDGKEVIVREYGEETFTAGKTQEERDKSWKEYLKDEVSRSSDFFFYRMTPPWYPLKSITEVDRALCPKCGSSEPVVKHISKDAICITGREINGVKRFIICCGEVREVAAV